MSRLRRLVRGLKSRVRSRSTGASRRFQLWVLGGPNSPGTRLGAVASTIAFVIVVMGMYGWITGRLETTGSSSWVVEVLFRVTTSVWSFAAIAFLAAIGLRLFRRHRSAKVAAKYTGFDIRSIKRLAEEAKTAAGSTSVLASPEDTRRGIADRVASAFGLRSAGERPKYDRILDEDGDAQGLEPSPKPTPAPANPDVETETDPDVDPVTLARLELASLLDFEDIVWRLLVPAVAMFLSLVIIAQLWVAPWVYAVLAGISLLFGIGYWSLVKYRRRSRVASLRAEEDIPKYADIAAVCKTVETPDMTLYYAWIDGDVLVDYDPERLAWTCADAALRAMHGYDRVPYVQQAFAKLLRTHHVDLQNWEEDLERPRIRDEIKRTVNDHDGPMAKNRVADRVIARSKQPIGAVGFDPRLIYEEYDDLVPVGIVEETVPVDTPSEEDVPMTIVRIRTDSMTPTEAASQVKFSADFNPHADVRVEMPDIDDTPPVGVSAQ